MGTLGSPKNAFFFSRTLLHATKEIGDVCTQASVLALYFCVLAYTIGIIYEIPTVLGSITAVRKMSQRSDHIPSRLYKV